MPARSGQRVVALKLTNCVQKGRLGLGLNWIQFYLSPGVPFCTALGEDFPYLHLLVRVSPNVFRVAKDPDQAQARCAAGCPRSPR